MPTLLTSNDIQKRIKTADPEAVCQAQDTYGNGYHFNIVVQSPRFCGQTTLNQQKSILNLFQPELRSGALHAVSIKTHEIK